MKTERIYELRKAQGLSMQELASKIGTSASAIYKWEHGKTESLRIDRLEQIAKVLGSSVEYLLGYVDSPHKKLVAADVSEEERELLKVYNNLSLKQRNRLLAYAWALEEQDPKYTVTQDENGNYQFKLK